MDTSQKVATTVLAKEYFVVRDILGELKGETIEASRVREYEKVLQEATDEFTELVKKVDGQLTPGLSNPRAGQYGRDLQRARRKGSKARARVEVAKYLRKQGLKKVVLSNEASGDFLVMKNPQKELGGETIEADKLGYYKVKLQKAELLYERQKDSNKDLRGRQRGEGGRELARLGEEKRKAQARVEAAEQLARRGLKKLTY